MIFYPLCKQQGYKGYYLMWIIIIDVKMFMIIHERMFWYCKIFLHLAIQYSFFPCTFSSPLSIKTYFMFMPTLVRVFFQSIYCSHILHLNDNLSKHNNKLVTTFYENFRFILTSFNLIFLSLYDTIEWFMKCWLL